MARIQINVKARSPLYIFHFKMVDNKHWCPDAGVFNWSYFISWIQNIVLLDFQVMWDDIIGEPEGLRSLDCTWNCSKFCFQVQQILVIQFLCLAQCCGSGQLFHGFGSGSGSFIKNWIILNSNFFFLKLFFRICFVKV